MSSVNGLPIMRSGWMHPGQIDPVDTIVVTGGPHITAVDASAVRSAAARMAVAGEMLREACRLTGNAWARVVAPPSVPGLAPSQQHLAGPDALAARQTAIDAIHQVTTGLSAQAEELEGLGRRLLRTAGLYEEAENITKRAIGALATAEGYVLGSLLGIPPVPQALGSAYRALGQSTSGQTTPAPGDHRTAEGLVGAANGTEISARRLRGADSGTAAPAERIVGAAIRTTTPWTDEFVLGLGLGMAGPTRVSADAGTSASTGVTAAAGELADAVRSAPVGTIGAGVRIERLTGHAFAAGPPTWQDTGAHSIEDTLQRVDALYPHAGAPPATIAVQQVTGNNGKNSWVVTIPGTQSATPAEHPWDGLTDAELLAGQPDQASEAIQAAMTDAGVGPDEPVVLVGHSLGGMAAMALAGRSSFTERFRVGGVVTAGSPVATFRSPPGVPVLHLEAAEGVVANLDGRSGRENPRTADRVTVGRVLSDSSAPWDCAVSGQVVRAHGVGTHVRTLALARESGDPRVTAVTDRIEPLLSGDLAETKFYRAERAVSRSASNGQAGSP